MHHMDTPKGYHLWSAMLEYYQRHMPKLANIILTILSTIQNDLLHEFINKPIV